MIMQNNKIIVLLSVKNCFKVEHNKLGKILINKYNTINPYYQVIKRKKVVDNINYIQILNHFKLP
jgi:hypothetical protein